MAIEIVDFTIENGGSFHSYVTVYQRVNMMILPFATCKISRSHGVFLTVPRLPKMMPGQRDERMKRKRLSAP
jgi:hypothetical protein